MTTRRDELIGDRAEETLGRVRVLLEGDRDGMSSWMESFLVGLEEKLETWGTRAFVNAAQLNRLSDIEQRVEARRFGR